ncbi:12338_t:CDS:2, partial [Cetraspora pellucida]
SQILEHIKNLLQIWNLELKIISFTTDNGANIKKAIKDLGIGTQIFCAAHTLQLSINKGLEEISELIGKCKNLIKFLGAIITLKTILFSDKKTNIQREGIILESLIPTNFEWQIIEKLVPFLESFEQVTCLISGTKYTTLSVIYPIIIGLVNQINKSSNINNNIVRNIKEIIQEDMNER